MQIDRLQLQPAYQAIFGTLQKFILSGSLRPGDALPPETELAEKFGVNRSTIREGIRQLEAEGLVARASRKKLVVAVPGARDVAPRVTRAMVMNNVTFRELFDVAIMLEPYGAELAARLATLDDVEALDANLAKQRAQIAKGEPTIETDLEFHSLIAACSGNQVLLLSRAPVSMLLFKSFDIIAPDVDSAEHRNLVAHTEIVERVRSRDAAGARDWMERHMRDFERGWLLAGRGLDDRIDPSITYG